MSEDNHHESFAIKGGWRKAPAHRTLFDVLTFLRKEADPEGVCRFSTLQIAIRLNASQTSVLGALRKLQKTGVIERRIVPGLLTEFRLREAQS